MTLLDEHPKTETQRLVWRRIAFLGGVAVGATVLLVVTAVSLGSDRELSNTAMVVTDEEGTVSLIDTTTGEWIYQAPDAVIALTARC